jgi:predicted dehydrogenase
LTAELEHPECEIVFDLPPPRNDYPGSWGLDAGGSFVRAILGHEPPFCTGEEGMKSLQVILAFEAAAKTGKRVQVGSV